MTAQDFLRQEGLLQDGFTKFHISFDDGKTVELVDLLEKFYDQKAKEAIIILNEFDRIGGLPIERKTRL